MLKIKKMVLKWTKLGLLLSFRSVNIYNMVFFLVKLKNVGDQLLEFSASSGDPRTVFID